MEPFDALFGRPADVRADAPGRVNVIGEHTDYSGGFVLPVAIPQRARVELARAPGREARIVSASFGVRPEAYLLGEEARRGAWVDYAQGVTFALREAGFAVGGFVARVESDVPIGAGLSSGAAFAVALLRALRAAFGLDLDDVNLARLAQRGENAIVLAPTGLMDPMAASLADERTALFLDTRAVTFERVSLPADAELVVVDSGTRHDNASGEYRARREECERAASLLGVPMLRDVGAAHDTALAALPPPLDRRARHVVRENARVLLAVAAMKRGDAAELGRLMNASHASLKDDYEVTVPALDRLAALARAEPEVYGARMTGAGFGGAIVALARAGTGPEVAERIARIAGEPARAVVPAPLTAR